MCVDYAGTDVMIYPCHGSLGNQQWIFEEDVSFFNIKIVTTTTN